MIVTQLPDAQNFTNAAQAETGNVAVCAATTGKYYYPAHETPYLLVTNYLSTGSYVINKQKADINEKYFYFLQGGSRLEINFAANTPLQTLLVQFNTAFITGVIHENTAADKLLLDDPFYTPRKDVYIPPVPFYVNERMQRLLAQLRNNTALNEVQFTYLLQDIIAEFCLLNNDTIAKVRSINAVKKSTKEELYRRLSMARLFMEDNACSGVTIDDIAKEACLNSFHFLRSFKQLYGITPHQFLLQARLKKAYDYLSLHQYTVTETCSAVGFESHGSFSNLFKKRFGVTPSSLLNQ